MVGQILAQSHSQQDDFQAKCYDGRNDEGEKVLIVVFADAVVHPATMVVEVANALVAGTAVLCALVHTQLADVAEVVGLLAFELIAELYHLLLERNYLVFRVYFRCHEAGSERQEKEYESEQLSYDRAGVVLEMFICAGGVVDNVERGKDPDRHLLDAERAVEAVPPLWRIDDLDHWLGQTVWLVLRLNRWHSLIRLHLNN